MHAALLPTGLALAAALLAPGCGDSAPTGPTSFAVVDLEQLRADLEAAPVRGTLLNLWATW